MNNLTELLKDSSPLPQPLMAEGILNDMDETATRAAVSAPIAPITDEEAECLLPGYRIAFEEYHIFRSEGASPEEALEKTLAEWRTLWAATAYVPHRPSQIS